MQVIKFLTRLTAVSLVLISLALGLSWHWLNDELDIADGHRLLVVPQGSSMIAVAGQLQNEGIIAYPRLWVAYARISGQTQIKAGEYKFAQAESPVTILAKLYSGEVTQYQVTLVEGSQFQDFLVQLHAQEKLRKTLESATARESLAGVGIELAYLEGWFYPDTYQYSAGDTDVDILQRAHAKMRRVLDQEWSGRQADLPYADAYEALIMASIVEKETGVPEERGEIAGVFVRRLQKGMRLQTDPTVIYGMGDSYDGNIRRRDLRTPTPYNTYVIRGLPPTPIAMPGREAIHAALNPKSGSSLYFVARGDGSHYFSDTLSEHQQAVQRYQKNRRPDYRSAPVRTSEQNDQG